MLRIVNELLLHLLSGPDKDLVLSKMLEDALLMLAQPMFLTRVILEAPGAAYAPSCGKHTK